MIMGHAALVVLCKRTILSLAPIPLMILAVYGPDVIDKSAALVLGTPGKWAGHSLLIFAIVTLALLFIPARRLAPAWWVLSLFWLSHLVLDITDPVVLLWPLLGEFPPGPPYDFSEGFIAFYSGRGRPAVLALDIIFLLAALVSVTFGRMLRKHRGLSAAGRQASETRSNNSPR